MNTFNPLSSETSKDDGNSQQNPISFTSNAESNNEIELDLERDTALDCETETQMNPLSLASHSRYLIARIEQQQLAFPLAWVSELMLIEQSQILPLPFYDPMVFGVLHDKGHGVPLIVAPLANKTETATVAQHLRTKRTLTAVRLNSSVGKLAGVGVIVEQVIERFATVSPPDLRPQVQVFQLEDIPSSIWQPRSVYACSKGVIAV